MEGDFLLTILSDQHDQSEIKYVGTAKENDKYEISVDGGNYF